LITLEKAIEEYRSNKYHAKIKFLLLYYIFEVIEKDRNELTGDSPEKTQIDVNRLLGFQTQEIFNLKDEEEFLSKLDELILRFTGDRLNSSPDGTDRSIDLFSLDGFVANYSEIFGIESEKLKRNYTLFRYAHTSLVIVCSALFLGVFYKLLELLANYSDWLPGLMLLIFLIPAIMFLTWISEKIKERLRKFFFRNR
jgi:hypothetical protein